MSKSEPVAVCMIAMMMVIIVRRHLRSSWSNGIWQPTDASGIWQIKASSRLLGWSIATRMNKMIILLSPSLLTYCPAYLKTSWGFGKLYFGLGVLVYLCILDWTNGRVVFNIPESLAFQEICIWSTYPGQSVIRLVGKLVTQFWISILSASLSPHKASTWHCGVWHGGRQGGGHGGRHGGGQSGRQKENKLAKLRRCASQVSFGLKKFGLN